MQLSIQAAYILGNVRALSRGMHAPCKSTAAAPPAASYEAVG